MANDVTMYGQPGLLTRGWDLDSSRRNGRLDRQRRDNAGIVTPIVVTECEMRAEKLGISVEAVLALGDKVAFHPHIG